MPVQMRYSIYREEHFFSVLYIEIQSPTLPPQSAMQAPCSLLFAYKEQSEYSNSVSEELLRCSATAAPRFAICIVPAKFLFGQVTGTPGI